MAQRVGMAKAQGDRAHGDVGLQNHLLKGLPQHFSIHYANKLKKEEKKTNKQYLLHYRSVIFAQGKG